MQQSATHRVLGALDTSVAKIVRGYLDEPLTSPEWLAEQSKLYLKQLESLADEGELLDLELASDLNSRCTRLLNSVDESTPEEHRRLIQAATRYFCSTDDANCDIDSLIGLDDDLAVIEAVALALDLGHLLED